MAHGPGRYFVRGPSALGLALAIAASAADAAARADEPTQDEVQVEVRGSQTGAFASRVSLDDSPREVADVAGLVEQAPGVHVRRLGAEDGFATLSIRGSSSNEVMILLAGVPLTGGADPSLDLGSLPLWPGAKAKVYRTFAPAVLGQGSLGGTLVLDPPNAAGPGRSEVWDAVGSYGAARLRVADVRDWGGGVRVSTALSASRATDDFAFYDPDHSPAFQTRANDGHAAASGLVSVSVPVRWSSEREGTLTSTTLLQARHQQLPGSITTPTPFASLDSNRELSVLELTRGAEAGAWYGRVWERRDELGVRSPTSDEGILPARSNDGIFALGGATGFRGHILPALRVDARLDASQERYAPGQYLGSAVPVGANRSAVGGGADIEWSAVKRASFALSGRLDQWTDQSEGSPDRSEVRPTAHLGVDTRIGILQLTAHGGAVARPPSFIELYGNEGNVLGNAALKSESAWSADAGASVATRGRLRLSAEVVGFATWAENLIVFVDEGMVNIKATNIGRARIFGGEASVRASAYGFALRAAYTGLATFNDSECGPTAGCRPPPLPGRPAHGLVADATYTWGPVTARYGVDFVSGLHPDAEGAYEVPARALQSAGIHVDVPNMRGWRVGAEVRNLFDLRTGTYEGAAGPVKEPIGDLYDYPLPGRTFLVTARWFSMR